MRIRAKRFAALAGPWQRRPKANYLSITTAQTALVDIPFSFPPLESTPRMNRTPTLASSVRWLSLLVWLAFWGSTQGFAPATTTSRFPSSTTKSTTTSTSLHCICIHCARVTDCKAYHFVETKHNQPHMTAAPTFVPREGTPTIHVNVRTVAGNDNNASVLDQIRQEHQAEEAAARKLQQEENDDNSNSNSEEEEEEEALHGKTVYDISSATTIEYDVVACEDFVHEQDCWVRNMPEEIKKANPNFVPT